MLYPSPSIRRVVLVRIEVTKQDCGKGAGTYCLSNQSNATMVSVKSAYVISIAYLNSTRNLEAQAAFPLVNLVVEQSPYNGHKLSLNWLTNDIGNQKTWEGLSHDSCCPHARLIEGSLRKELPEIA